MIRKANDIKLKVLPVWGMAEHLYYYEGPCRFGQGEALQPGYDRLSNAQMQKEVLTKLEAALPDNVELLAPVKLERTDDWDNHEAMYENAAAAAAEADVFFTYNRIASDDIVNEFIQRFHKPTVIAPDSGFAVTVHTASLFGLDDDLEVYGCYKWEDVTFQLSVLRAKKVIQSTRILCASRFGSTTSLSSVDSFNNYEAITKNLGVRFRYINIHELFDQMSPAVEGGNPTTPGRKTLDMTEEDMEKVEAMADEISQAAVENHIDREYLKNSLKAYVAVQKQMDFKDCNGFTVPCPDACSTRRLNEMKFTFCLTHSLNMEQGIPSACEYDVDAVLSQQALMAVSGKGTYMGNTTPIPYENGKLTSRFGATPEQYEKLMENPENIYMMQHSVANRCIREIDKKEPYALRPFAYDQKFGATIRYDFDHDAGQTVTVARFSPAGDTLFIGRGTIIMGGGYESGNCSQLVYFRVNNQNDFFKKQCKVGNHLSMVYGDYVKELLALAESLGIQSLVSA
ncbi:MAG: fucose isomerase [Oscillospiraceae bacterium]|nr:fucose isomerase [Oscillospiraceae bacterium]